MTKLFSAFTILVIGTALTVGLPRATIAVAQLDSPPKAQDENIDVRLARAHVALARLDLKRAIESNKRVPGVYSAEFIEKLKLHVVIDQAHLQENLKGKDADAHEVCIRQAEAAVALAKADLQRESGIQRRSPSARNVLNVERAKIVAEISKLNLEQTQQLDASESVEKHLQWQIDQLRHQVLELQMRR